MIATFNLLQTIVETVVHVARAFDEVLANDDHDPEDDDCQAFSEDEAEED